MALPRSSEAVCIDCLDQLTPGEVHWFGYRCEVCEGLWHERIAAWRRGAHDPMLERALEDLQPTVH